MTIYIVFLIPLRVKIQTQVSDEARIMNILLAKGTCALIKQVLSLE